MRLPGISVGATGLLGLVTVACSSPPQIGSTTVPTNTFDATGPYLVTTVVRTGAADGLSVLYCADPACLATGAPAPPTGFHEIVMAKADGGAGVWSGEIPGQPQGTVVVFYVRARGGGGEALDPPAAQSASGTRMLYTFSVLAPSGPCRVDADCGPGQRCDASKACHEAPVTCRLDADCGASSRCLDGRCRLRDRRCAADADCLSGEWCDRAAGTCVPRTPCTTMADCPETTVCDAASPEAGGVCRAACGADADCDPTERCAAASCTPRAPCKTAAECPAGLACDAGVCRATGGALCAACAADADCGGDDDDCLVAPGKTVGVCGVACDKTGACPKNAACDTSTPVPQCVPASCP